MKSCEMIQDDLARMVQGDCDETETRQLREHLSACTACREYLEGLQSDDRNLRAYVQSCEPSIQRIREQVMARLHEGRWDDNSINNTLNISWIRYAIAACLMGAILLTAAVLIQNYRMQNTFVKDPDPTGVAQPTGTPPNPEPLGDKAPLPIQLPEAKYLYIPSIGGINNLEPLRSKSRPPFYAPKGAINVALNKPVILSEAKPIHGEARMITDGNKNATEGSYVEMGPFARYTTIDLQGEYEIYAILFWHFYSSPRVYKDVIVQISNDPEFKEEVVTLFNNDHDNTLGLGEGKDKHYFETNEGRLVDAKGLRARYVRLYSNGSFDNDFNHLIEVEVYGKPVTPAVNPSGYVPLPLVLPKQVFIGTPPILRDNPNTEPYTKKTRPPYYVPAGLKNLAYQKPVTSSDSDPILGEFSMITDGDKEAVDGSFIELGPMQQHVTIDLEGDYEIYAIAVWHYHKEARIYSDVIVQIASDRDFISASTVFNNDIDNTAGLGVGSDKGYVEDYQGKLIDGKGTRGRFVRLYSAGSSANDLNHYIEVEIWGRAIAG